MTQLDVLMALRPEDAMAYDLANGELTFGGVPVYVRETGELEYPYGDSTFTAAILTAKVMEYTYATSLRGSTVLELGAGTGTLGLVAAALGARRVVLTDLPCSIKQLRDNVALNVEKWKRSSSPFEVRELDWFESGDVEKLGEFDFILGSELMFDEDLLDPLANVLRALLRCNPRAVVLLGYQDRLLVGDDDIDRAFGPFFKVELVPSSEMHPSFRVNVCKTLRVYRIALK